MRRNDTARVRRSSRGRIIEEGIGVGVEDLVGHRRGQRGIDRQGANPPLLDGQQQRPQSVDVHGLVQAIGDRFVDQWVIGGIDGPGMIIPAGQLRWEDGGEQVLRPHALDGNRHPLPPLMAQNGQGASAIPAPTIFEHRGRQCCLNEITLQGCLAHHGKHVFQRKAMLSS